MLSLTIIEVLSHVKFLPKLCAARHYYLSGTSNFPSSYPILECLADMLSENKIKSTGIFNPELVNNLLIRMKTKAQVSEIDNMALTGILSVQILHDLFVQKSVPKLNQNDLLEFDKVIIDY